MNVFKILKLSVLTSLMSKSTGVLFQIIAIPLALTLLGTDGFALFMIYTGLTTWVGLCSTGVAPSLTARIATGTDNKVTAQYFMNAVFFISAIILFIGLPVFLCSLSLIDLVGGSVQYSELLMVYLFVGLLIITGVVDSVNAGRNQTYITNLYFSIGNILNLFFMLIAVEFFELKSPFFVYIMSQLGILIVRLINNIQLIQSLRIEFNWIKVNKDMMKELRANFSSFFFIQLYPAISQQAIVLLSYSQSKELSAALSVIYRIYSLIASMLTMVAIPLWPMIVKARASGNFLMLKLWYHRLIIYNAAASASFCLAVYFFRDQINFYWLKGQLSLTDLEYCLFLTNYFLIAIGQANTTFLFGFEDFSVIAKMLVAEMILLIFLLVLVEKYNPLDLTVIILISAASFIFTSLWFGFYFVNNKFKSRICS